MNIVTIQGGVFVNRYMGYIFRISENYVLHTIFLILTFLALSLKNSVNTNIFWFIIIPSFFLIIEHFSFVFHQGITHNACKFLAIFSMLGTSCLLLGNSFNYIPYYSFYVMAINGIFLSTIHIHAIKKGIYFSK